MARKVSREILVQLVLKVLSAHREFRDLKALRVLKVIREIQVRKVLLVQKVTLVHKALPGHKVRRELLVLRVIVQLL
ncbi:hypothetical protein D3C80_1493650 [compost metagenome]